MPVKNLDRKDSDLKQLMASKSHKEGNQRNQRVPEIKKSVIHHAGQDRFKRQNISRNPPA